MITSDFNIYTMTTIQQELSEFDWIVKFNEKLTFILLNIKSHRDIKEEDYELLRVLFRIYCNGEYVIYETVADLPKISQTQQTLFGSVNDDLADISGRHTN